jgi:ubiquinone/menaquinone biosynthesis C-methylase UbiE
VNDRRPDPFEDTFAAPIAARAVISATSLGVFEALAEDPADAIGLAARLQLSTTGVEALLAALVALGYLHCDAQGVHRVTEVTARALFSDSPETLATFAGPFGALTWDSLGRLDQTLRGGPPAAWHEREPGDPAWAAYIRGLFELTRDEHAANAALVPVDHPRTLLEIAGGHAGFAMAMCRLHPQLSATVLDLPASAEVGRSIVGHEGFSDRISFREGDALEADLGENLDVIAYFNLAHHLPPDRNVALARRAREALASGGCLVIGETERAEPGEQFTRLGSLSGLLYFASSGTRNYTQREVTEWLEQAGFGLIEIARSERSPWRLVYFARA